MERQARQALENVKQILTAAGSSLEQTNMVLQEMGHYLGELDEVMTNILDTRAKVGSRINTLQEQEQVNEDFLLAMKTTRSREEDLDYAEAVSRFQQQLTAFFVQQPQHHALAVRLGRHLARG